MDLSHQISPQLALHFPEIMSKLLAVFCFLLTATSLSSGQEHGDENRQTKRSGKLLSVFQIIKFPNDACNSSSTQGVCYTSTECSTRGGSSGATCASGFGVCCLFTKGCGSVASENNTYFTSDSYVSPCEMKVCKSSSDICQFRLTFVKFESSQPATVATSITNCIDSMFTATSDGDKVPTICGTNTGDHMYLEAEEQCNLLQMVSRLGTTDPSFNILISQIPCTASFKAPQGCLQFFTGVTGTLRNFNFAGGTHLANQDVTQCIRQEEGFCSITYADATIFDISTGGRMRDSECTEDYLVVEGAGPDDRFCGSTFRSITYSVRPWRVIFISDGTDAALTDKQGYQLTYVQDATLCL